MARAAFTVSPLLKAAEERHGRSFTGGEGKQAWETAPRGKTPKPPLRIC
jgi:hypothetical protein